MTLIALIAPSAMMAGVGLAHLSYYRHFSRRPQQQAVALDELGYRGAGGRFRVPQAGVRALAQGHRAGGTYVALGTSGRSTSAPASLFDRNAEPVHDAAHKRTMVGRDAHVGAGCFSDTLIFGGDLRIEGDCTFLGPVKVAGDLAISGNAVFAKPLIVNGNVAVLGLAAIRTGMLVKGEVCVSGTLIVGEQGREGWVIARAFTNRGRIFLNGHADAVGHDLRARDFALAA